MNIVNGKDGVKKVFKVTSDLKRSICCRGTEKNVAKVKILLLYDLLAIEKKRRDCFATFQLVFYVSVIFHV